MATSPGRCATRPALPTHPPLGSGGRPRAVRVPAWAVCRRSGGDSTTLRTSILPVKVREAELFSLAHLARSPQSLPARPTPRSSKGTEAFSAGAYFTVQLFSGVT